MKWAAGGGRSSTGFAWNDRGYDARTTWTQALSHLAGGDATAARALGVFAGLEHLAPVFGDTPWQPQAPALGDRLDRFRTQWKAGRRTAALADLGRYATEIAQAPARIRGGAVQEGFVTDAEPWLKATGPALSFGSCRARGVRPDPNERP